MSTRFQPPTMEELQLQATKIGLPPNEAQMFYCYYASKGWKVGKAPMKQWRIALTGWKLRWEERRGSARSNGAETVVRHEEFKRVEAKMKSIRDSYAEHQSWSEQDRARFSELRMRKERLKELLGMQV